MRSSGPTATAWISPRPNRGRIKCCCGGLEGMVKYGMGNIASSGYVARVDTGLCDGCGKCEASCPFGAVKVDGASAVLWEKCMGCGVCEGQCPRQAVQLVRDERKGVPFDVRMLAGPPAGGPRA